MSTARLPSQSTVHAASISHAQQFINIRTRGLLIPADVTKHAYFIFTIAGNTYAAEFT